MTWVLDPLITTFPRGEDTRREAKQLAHHPDSNLVLFATVPSIPSPSCRLQQASVPWDPSAATLGHTSPSSHPDANFAAGNYG